MKAASTANAFLTRLEGEKDGLVSVPSAAWGERKRILRARGLRGISHLDEIDLRRRPQPDGDYDIAAEPFADALKHCTETVLLRTVFYCGEK